MSQFRDIVFLALVMSVVTSHKIAIVGGGIGGMAPATPFLSDNFSEMKLRLRLEHIICRLVTPYPMFISQRLLKVNIIPDA